MTRFNSRDRKVAEILRDRGYVCELSTIEQDQKEATDLWVTTEIDGEPMRTQAHLLSRIARWERIDQITMTCYKPTSEYNEWVNASTSKVQGMAFGRRYSGTMLLVKNLQLLMELPVYDEDPAEPGAYWTTRGIKGQYGTSLEREFRRLLLMDLDDDLFEQVFLDIWSFEDVGRSYEEQISRMKERAGVKGNPCRSSKV